MKILILTNFGMGLYKFRKELIEALIQKGHEVHVALPKDEYTTRLIALGCKFIETKVDRRGMNVIHDGKLLLSYFKLMYALKPDYVFSYTIKPNIYGGIASRLFNVQFIPNITGLGTSLQSENVMSNFIIQLYKFALKNSAVVFFQNEDNQTLFREKNVIRKRSDLLPGSGVNLTDYPLTRYPEDTKDVRLLFVGRFMKEKGIEELIWVAEKLHKEKSRAEIHIIGFGDDKYIERLKELDKEKKIVFHGKQEHVLPFIQNSHAMLLPSYHEGTSNVLLEGASVGRPILASNIPGCKEVFDDGITGYGFSVKNRQELYKTIQKFVSLPYHEKSKMGALSRKKIEQEYDRTLVIKKYFNYLDEESI